MNTFSFFTAAKLESGTLTVTICKRVVGERTITPMWTQHIKWGGIHRQGLAWACFTHNLSSLWAPLANPKSAMPDEEAAVFSCHIVLAVRDKRGADRLGTSQNPALTLSGKILDSLAQSKCSLFNFFYFIFQTTSLLCCFLLRHCWPAYKAQQMSHLLIVLTLEEKAWSLRIYCRCGVTISAAVLTFRSEMGDTRRQNKH